MHVRSWVIWVWATHLLEYQIHRLASTSSLSISLSWASSSTLFAIIGDRWHTSFENGHFIIDVALRYVIVFQLDLKIFLFLCLAPLDNLLLRKLKSWLITYIYKEHVYKGLKIFLNTSYFLLFISFLLASCVLKYAYDFFFIVVDNILLFVIWFSAVWNKIV